MFQDGKKKTISSTWADGGANPGTVPPPNRSRGQHQPQRLNRKQLRKCGMVNTGFLRFLFSKFRYSLTALSRGFASFPHGTCTLSVSHQYLALDGIYHLIRAAIPNNSTRRIPSLASGRTGVSPSSLPRSRGLRPLAEQENLQTTIRHKCQFTNWADGASLAVTEPILVSFFSSAY